jgi:hypothetical protein
MKKILFAAMALTLMCACSGEREYLTYRGLSMGLPFKAFDDSLKAQGFVVDTAHSNKEIIKYTHPKETFVLTVGQRNDTILAIEEYYTASYNDSTRQLWQQLRDRYAEELDRMPGCPYLGDDHKEAEFETPKGIVNILLQNRSIPSLTLHLDRMTQDELIKKKKGR